MYKTRVPVCGIILINESFDKCLLVKGWKSNSTWGFPKGKINQSEPKRDCAIREVFEETGFDSTDLLKPDSKDYMDLTMKDQKIRLYIVKGVDEDTVFETRTRKEISVGIDNSDFGFLREQESKSLIILFPTTLSLLF